MAKQYIAISEGVIETLTGEARSADVKVGDIFEVTGTHNLGYLGTLKIKGLWSHQPGLSGKKVDSTPTSESPVFLLRIDNIEGYEKFFAQFTKVEDNGST